MVDETFIDEIYAEELPPYDKLPSSKAFKLAKELWDIFDDWHQNKTDSATTLGRATYKIDLVLNDR